METTIYLVGLVQGLLLGGSFVLGRWMRSEPGLRRWWR